MKISKMYLYVVLSLMLVLPVTSILIECYLQPDSGIIALIGKWFTFWAVGVRLFTAGLKQALNPAFTAKDIFHIDNVESQVIVRELGFANICIGCIGILSAFLPGWRMAAAFVGGLYMGIAGIQHIIKKPASPNEMLAMISDLFIMVVMGAYLLSALL